MLRRQSDGDHDAFQIFHHIVIGESEHAISARCKPFITSAVVAETGFEIMTLAVDLNDELAGMCDEINDITAHGALSAKSERRQPMRFQVAPQ